MKSLTKLFALVMMLVIASGSYLDSKASSVEPDFTGTWDITFYDAAGKIQGGKTITIEQDGSISSKTNMNLNNTIYVTEISATVSPRGTVQDGTLTNTDKLDMQGILTGTFTETEGNGQWKDYYGKSGTWKAVRSEKMEKR